MNQHINKNVEKLTEELAASFVKTDARRQQWHSQTKGFIAEQLGHYANKYPMLDWKVAINEAWENLESVYLTFNNTPSGIVEKNELQVIQKVKKGGLVSFSQSRNGQIVIWVAYPVIDGLTEDGPKSSTLETLEPEEIDDDCILRNVEKFLTEMLEWENNDREEIGFVRKHR